MKQSAARSVIQFLVAIAFPLWLAILLVVVAFALLWFAAGEVLDSLTEAPR